jgi:NADH-quinone oxidoreductase subunit A
MEANATALVLYLLLVVAAAGAIIALTAAFGRGAAPASRGIAYECGLDPATPGRRRVSIHFFLIAALFLIFDVEVVLLFPWASAIRHAIEGSGGPLLLELAVFLGLLALALCFAWGQGALDWEQESVTRDS